MAKRHGGKKTVTAFLSVAAERGMTSPIPREEREWVPSKDGWGMVCRRRRRKDRR